MTTLTETLPHDGGFVVSEANGRRSRETDTFAQRATVYRAGEVLGRITASGKLTTYNNGAADGTETAVAICRSEVDATAADAEGVIIARDAEVSLAELVFDDGQNQAAQDAAVVDLAAAGIIAR